MVGVRVLLALLLIGTPTAAAQWHHAQGDEANRRALDGPTDGSMEIAWTAASSSPDDFNRGDDFLLANGTHVVFVRSWMEEGYGPRIRTTLQSVRLSDGAIAWESSIDTRVTEQPIWTVDGIALAGWRRSDVQPFQAFLSLADPDDGSLRAEAYLGAGTPEALTSDGKAIYVAFGDTPRSDQGDATGGITRIEGPELRKAWTRQATGVASLQASGDLLIERRTDALSAYNENSSLQWSTFLAGFSENEPAIEDGVVVTTTGYPAHVSAHNLLTGALLWAKPLEAVRITPPVIDGDRVVFALEEEASSLNGAIQRIHVQTLDRTTGFETTRTSIPNSYLDRALWNVRPGLVLAGDVAWIPAQVGVSSGEPGIPMLLGARITNPDETPQLVGFPEAARLAHIGLAFAGRLVFVGDNFRPEYTADRELVAFDIGGGVPEPPVVDMVTTPTPDAAGELKLDRIIFEGRVTSQRGIESYIWGFSLNGHSSVESGQRVTWFPNVPGPVEVTLTVTDEDGRTTTTTQSFLIRAPDRGLPSPFGAVLLLLVVAGALARKR